MLPLSFSERNPSGLVTVSAGGSAVRRTVRCAKRSVTKNGSYVSYDRTTGA